MESSIGRAVVIIPMPALARKMIFAVGAIDTFDLHSNPLGTQSYGGHVRGMLFAVHL